MKTLSRLVALILLTLVTTPAMAATKWLRADTHNFVIYSSGNAKQLQDFANNVERFDALLRHRLKVPREDRPNRLTIYLLAQADDVARMVGDKSRGVAGMYLPRADGSFAIANRDVANSKTELSGNTVLFHEYAHHFMFRNFTAPYPAWFVEGFAEFLSTATFKPNGEWTLGAPPYYRGYGQLEGPKVPIDSLLFEQAGRKDAASSDAFYGRSWLLVHMLTMESAWKGKFTAYVTAVGKGMPHREAAIAGFGDLATLDKAIDSYLKRSRVTVITSTNPMQVDGTITISELGPVPGNLVELGLKRRVGKDLTRTRDALKQLADANPTNAAVWYELAEAERAIGDDLKDDAAAKAVAATTAAVDKALAINPNHVRANVLKARLEFDRLAEAKDFSAASWRSARAFITKANTADNLDPEPLVTWHESFVRQGKQPTPTASEGLAVAYNLAPESTDLRAAYAVDLARLGKYDEAIQLVEVLAYSPHGGESGKALLEQLKRIRDGRKPSDEPDAAAKGSRHRIDQA